MQLGRHVDLCETNAIAETETQDAWISLYACADVKAFEGFIFQSAA